MFWNYDNSQSKVVACATAISSCDVTFFLFIIIANGFSVKTLLHLEGNFRQKYGCGIPYRVTRVQECSCTLMSCVQVKLLLSHKLFSTCVFLLSSCMSGHITERPDPPKSGSDCLHDCFPEGCEGVERGLG